VEITAAGAPGATHTTDAFVLFRGTDDTSVRVNDAALVRAAQLAIKSGEFSGKKGETLLLHGGKKGRRLLLAGLGDSGDRDALLDAAAAAARMLETRAIRRATLLVPKGGDGDDAAALAEGAGLAQYAFTELKSSSDKRRLTRIVVAPEQDSISGLRARVREASDVVDAVSFARDLGNLPGNIAHAVYLAKRARELSGGGVTVKIHNRADIKRMKMGAFYAVAQASSNEPRLIEFKYRGKPGGKTIALVGKGVTFDTGGISIKPSGQMEDMKFDMCGAAAVLGLMHLVAARKPKLNLHALVPATDNMPGGAAYRPGDIVRARNGKTIEIHSTDAEGRLLLCDALSYVAERKPACIIDLATLTGACVVALGDAACGLFSNDDEIAGRVADAGLRTGERAWHMPIYPRHTEMMKGVYADLQNSGVRWGGACTAAAFLKEFVGDVPWAHLDIAGVAWTDKDAGIHRRGATGFGVRLLWEFLKAAK